MTLRPKSLLLHLLALPIVFLLAGCGSLQSISINPVAGFVVLNAVGQTAQYTALGSSQTGNASPTTSNISNAVNWTVGNPGVATISASGLVTAVGNGHTQVMAESGGKTATSDVTVNITAVNTGTNGASITSISVIPGSQSVSSLGQTSLFIAIGATSTGATVDLTKQVAWSSSSKTIATVDSTGLATAVGQGTATLTALYTNPTGGTVVTGTATFTVAGGTVKVTAVTITPVTQSVAAPGQTSQFIAIGATSTGTMVDLTNQVAWSSSSAQIATIVANTGLATAVGQGTATVTALYTNAFDGTVVKTTATLTVASGTVVKFTAVIIIPGSPSVSAPGQMSQFIAIGTTSTGATMDLTKDPALAWSSSNTQVATFSVPGVNPGLATAVGQGATTVTAMYTNIDKSVVTGVATFAVTGASAGNFTTLTITPASQSVSGVGKTSQFTAIGATSTGALEDLTKLLVWSSSSAEIATVVANTGLATAVGPGTATVTALYINASDNTVVRAIATLTVAGGTAEPYTSVTIIPGSQSIAAPGQMSQFMAIGVTSTGTTANITNLVAWGSSSAQIAAIDPITGIATAKGQGTATVTAIYPNADKTVLTGTATIIVAGATPATYTAVTITPGSQSLSASGQMGQLIALATSGSTGLKSDVTGLVQWSSSSPSIATVGAFGVVPGGFVPGGPIPGGLVTGKSVGASTITAELSNADGSIVSNTASVAITATSAPEPLLSLTIIPSSITVLNLQGTGQFLAIGTYSTPPYVRDLTNSPSLTWISDEPSVFTVNSNPSSNPGGNPGGNAGATAGIVTAYGSGSATIIAEASNIDVDPLTGKSSISIQTATATFNCPQALANLSGIPPTLGTCVPGTQAPALLSTLTVYNEGLNTTDWLVTASSATATPDVIHCGPGSTAGGSVCVATYPIVGTVVLTATGGNFGGWSYNCTPSDSSGNTSNPVITASGPNYCVVNFTLAVYDSTGKIVIVPANSNVTVGAIFN